MSSKAAVSANTLYIIYNADASIMGKLSYGYRKLTCGNENPACAACEITNGGLSLNQTPAWKQAKAEIMEGKKMGVKEVHRNELSVEMKRFIEENKLRYPMVLYSDHASGLHMTMNSEELAGYNGDAKSFVAKLNEKGALGPVSSSL